MKKPLHILRRCAAVAILLSVAPLVQGQGSLTPPGPPGPTMKTLSQIEPRVPIAAVPFSITTPGAYYLTGNVTAKPGQEGISVLADNVTLDLGGFSMIGAGGAAKAVTLSTGRRNFTLRNGSITGWGVGVDAAAGSNGSFESLRISDSQSHGLLAGANASLRDCSATSNKGHGIQTERGGLLRDCISRENTLNGFVIESGGQLSGCGASFNGGNGFQLADGVVIQSSTGASNAGHGLSGGANNVAGGFSSIGNKGAGIVLGDGASIAGAVARLNGTDGMRVGASSRVTDSTSHSNGQSGIVAGAGVQLAASTAAGNAVAGIQAEADAVIRECAASGNAQAGIAAGNGAEITGCKARSNSIGIKAGDASTVKNCTVIESSSDGILVTGDCTVSGNNCKGNFNARDASGIRATAADNLILENHLVANDRGISIEGAGSLVLRNMAANNTLSYFFTAAQWTAPVVLSTNDVNFAIPWVNFQY